ncbi:hypothetical protein PISMIDRAFT_20082 [Pisolithus microcarpus 441]|uniref:Uncharacterized protein n=1 Tax=Pisolithus microcarpus 441 TaxID=765257 RepID=A0A0C9YKC0_9AGAM|nr:hypothetical protein PISMIDRAFT_20082 [Pisolithus microcarpus 441]
MCPVSPRGLQLVWDDRLLVYVWQFDMVPQQQANVDLATRLHVLNRQGAPEDVQDWYIIFPPVQSELGPGVTYNPQVGAMLAYVDALHEEIVLPDLSTVVDSRTQPFFVSLKTTVRNVVKLMKEHRVTAICVMENSSAPEIEVD